MDLAALADISSLKPVSAVAKQLIGFFSIFEDLLERSAIPIRLPPFATMELMFCSDWEESSAKNLDI